MQNTFNRRHFLQTAGAGLALTGMPGWAQEKYPARAMNLVVPYPAGGASDATARIFAESFAKTLGQPVLVENHGGAGGMIGANKVLNNPADGYTFFHGSANEVFLQPMLNEAARYKPQDFMLSSLITRAQILLVVRRGIPVDSLDSFIAYAEQQKDKPLSYATVGIDSLYHLMGDALGKRLGLSFLHVPYKGGAPAIQGVAGGQVDFGILPYQSSMDGMHAQGMLNIVTSFSKSLPNTIAHIPLITQSQRVPDFEYTIGGGYFFKKGTPPERVQALRQAIGTALSNPDIRARLESEGRTVGTPVADQQSADQDFTQMYKQLDQLVKNLGRKNLAA